MMPTAGPVPDRACPKVATIIIISSTPSICYLSTPPVGKQWNTGGMIIRTHALTADDIGQPAEEQLTDEGAYRSCNFHAQILRGVQ